jgi:hypothetical protein
MEDWRYIRYADGVGTPDETKDPYEWTNRATEATWLASAKEPANGCLSKTSRHWNDALPGGEDGDQKKKNKKRE